MPRKPFKDYTIKELRDFLKKNEKDLEKAKEQPNPPLGIIKTIQEMDNNQIEAAAELTRKLKEKNPKSS